jgi:hypothetical protein
MMRITPTGDDDDAEWELDCEFCAVNCFTRDEDPNPMRVIEEHYESFTTFDNNTSEAIPTCREILRWTSTQWEFQSRSTDGRSRKGSVRVWTDRSGGGSVKRVEVIEDAASGMPVTEAHSN